LGRKHLGQVGPYGINLNDSGTGADASMDQAYLEGHHGNTSWTLGRQGIQLGQGLLYAWFANNDGATLTFGGDKTKLTLAAFKHETPVGMYEVGSGIYLPGRTDLNIVAANLSHKASEDLDLTVAYAKSREDNITCYGVEIEDDIEVVNSWALGAVYKGINNIKLTGEYGENRSDLAKLVNGDNAKAWVAQAKYKGAQWETPHSYGVWVGYRKAEPGFLGLNGDYVWETPTGIGSQFGYFMDDVKGYDIGFDYTVFKNGILTLQYFDMENEEQSWGQIDKQGFTAQLRYQF